ncbi:unnamed protein product [marine sediment metagenome]|uniref:Uncharacterized protein n=1 Tax=marine sediment metagenome TaxID=412755 RepID=X1VFR1_9ZZZZ
MKAKEQNIYCDAYMEVLKFQRQLEQVNSLQELREIAKSLKGEDALKFGSCIGERALALRFQELEKAVTTF